MESVPAGFAAESAPQQQRDSDRGQSPGGDFGGSNIILQGTNTYTGGTIVNGETLTIGATGTLPGSTNGLTLNNGTLTQTSGGVITPQAVTLNGSSTLTLVGPNSLTGLTINNIGGTATPTVTTGGVLTLTGITQVAASSSNVGTTAIINGALDFNAHAGVITVAPIQVTDPITTTTTIVAPLQATLNIAAVIQNANGLTVSGGGLLQLSGQSTFGAGVTVSNGGLIIGANR